MSLRRLQLKKGAIPINTKQTISVCDEIVDTPLGFTQSKNFDIDKSDSEILNEPSNVVLQSQFKKIKVQFKNKLQYNLM